MAARTSDPARPEPLDPILVGAPIAVVRLDASGRVLALNRAAEAMFDWSGAEVAGRSFVAFAVPERGRGMFERWLRCAPSAAIGNCFAGRLVDRAGSTFSVECSRGPRVDGVDTLFLKDISERTRVARELEESLSCLQATLEASADGILVVDGQRRIAHYNARFVDMWGLPASVIDAGDSNRCLAFAIEQIKDREAVLDRVKVIYETPDVDSDDVLELLDGRVVERYSRPLRVGGGYAGRVWTFRDVTERRKIERELLVSARMAFVGTVAAGVAHEINNPLSYTTANLELLASALAGDVPGGAEDPAELTEMAKDALEGARRVTKIVRDLKTFSHGATQERTAVDVRAVLDAALKLSGRQLTHKARVAKTYEPVPVVDADESRLAQVFINLLVNAADAIDEGAPQGNEIHVRTTTDARGAVVVEIADTGKGMAQDVLASIFDPFFSTKPVGVGSGLGLSICHSIVKGFGGEITAESTVGSGTRMRVVLPPGAREPARPRPSIFRSPPTSARVLVIDDDERVAATLARALRPNDVVVVTSGADALARLEAERFDVVLCDVMMPGMSGADVHAAIAARFPRVLDRFVIMTGGSFSAATRAFVDTFRGPRVDKPFDLDALRALVAKVARRSP